MAANVPCDQPLYAFWDVEGLKRKADELCKNDPFCMFNEKNAESTAQ